MVIDLKAFYASVECAERHLDPFHTPLVVCDISRGPGSIILSVSPYLKSLGIPSRLRRFELPEIPHVIYATPRMELYVQKSTEVMSIFLDFIGEDDLHIYSIDEAFLHISPYLRMYQSTPKQLASRILERIQKELSLPATCGIGPNMFLAKMALDIEAKKVSSQIAEWTYDDVPTKLYPLKPLSFMWGISKALEKRLNNLGIETVEDLAHYPLEILKKEFGVIGEELKMHAQGRDDANIRERYQPSSHGLSLSQVLFRDYSALEARLIVEEMCDELCAEMRLKNKKTSVVHLGIGYALPELGFYHQEQLPYATNSTRKLKETLLHIYDRYIEDLPIRKISISFGKIHSSEAIQLDLFSPFYEEEKDWKIEQASDEIRKRYGKNAILRTTALEKHSTIQERHNTIGGHRK